MRKINLIAIFTALFLTFVIGMQPVSASTNHLLVLNTKKNTMGYYMNYKFVKTTRSEKYEQRLLTVSLIFAEVMLQRR